MRDPQRRAPANQIKAMIFAYPSYASDIGSMV
jgi:hypothetical protein